MSAKSRQLGGTRFVCLNSALTLTGTPVCNGAGTPVSQTVALLQKTKVTDWVSTGEVWRPLGVMVQSTTSITVTAPVLTLEKAATSATSNTFAAASSGGIATASLLAAGSAKYYPFTDYSAPTSTSPNATNFTADAAGDVWTVAVTTSPTAGAANIQLGYALINVVGISDAVTTL